MQRVLLFVVALTFATPAGVGAGSVSAPTTSFVVDPTTLGAKTSVSQFFYGMVPVDPSPEYINQTVLALGLTFKNISNVAITQIGFVFQYVAVDGTILGQQHRSLRGSFAPNVAIVEKELTILQGAVGPNGLCYSYDASETISKVLISVDDINYADGTVWSIPIPSSEGSTSISQDVGESNSDILITRFFGDAIPHGPEFDHIHEGLQFENRGFQTVSSVKFTYRYFDWSGNLITTQSNVAIGSFGPKDVTSDKGTDVTPPGTILSNGAYVYGYGPQSRYVARVVVSVDDIKYQVPKSQDLEILP